VPAHYSLSVYWPTLLLQAVHGSQGRSGGIRVKETTAVGRRERLVVGHYQGAEYLIGVTAAGITLLDKILVQEHESEAK